MSVGSQATEGQINQNLTALAVSLRDLAQQCVQQRAYLNKLGTAGLEAAGFSAQDAATVLQLIDDMGTVADVYHGTVGQASPFNFEDALTPLWAGQ